MRLYIIYNFHFL